MFDINPVSIYTRIRLQMFINRQFSSSRNRFNFAGLLKISTVNMHHHNLGLNIRTNSMETDEWHD